MQHRYKNGAISEVRHSYPSFTFLILSQYRGVGFAKLDETDVVIKRLRVPEELKTLKAIQSFADYHEHHILTFLESYNEGSLKPIIVMPKYSPASEMDLPGKFCSVYASQLIDAASFLPSNLICHLDIRLSNIVIDEDRQQLFLIDFGLAVILKSSADVLMGRGTPGLVSPELNLSCFPEGGDSL